MCFSSEMRQQVSDILRNDNYIKNLPPFPVECSESHLNALNMPVIFEEIYVENPSADDIISCSSPTSTNGFATPSKEDEVLLNGQISTEKLASNSLLVLNPPTVLSRNGIVQSQSPVVSSCFSVQNCWQNYKNS